MPWTVTISTVDKQGPKSVVYADFTDGTQTKRKEYTVDSAARNLAWLKRNIKADLDDLNSLDSSALNVPTGPIDLSEPGPTQAELDKRAYLQDFRRVMAYKRLIDVGAKLATDSIYTQAVSRLNTNFKNEYLDYMQ